MYNDLKFALSALRQPFSLFVLVASFVLTLTLFLALSGFVGWLVSSSGWIPSGWMETIASATGGLLTLIIGWFLFPATMAAISCLFLEHFALRAERQHYPDMPAPRASDWGDAVVLTTRTLWRTLVWHLLALPVYFIPVINIAAYFAVNTRLLSHEFFYALALRHLPLEQADALYEKERRTLLKTGAQLAVLFLIPGLNVLAPLLATSLMLNRLERRPDGLLRQRLN